MLLLSFRFPIAERLDKSYGYFFIWRNTPQWARASSFTRFLDLTQRRTTVGRTALDGWSPRRTDLTTQHSQQTNIHAPCGIRTYNLRRRAAADVRLRPRGHWDRLLRIYRKTILLLPMSRVVKPAETTYKLCSRCFLCSQNSQSIFRVSFIL